MMEWKTAKELAAELGVSSNAIYDAAKREGCVRGMRITKRGALYSGTPKDGVNDAPRGPKHRIPKPPLTIVEEATGEEGQGDIEALRKEFLDKIDWVDACRKVDAEGLGRKVDRLNERLDLWTSKLEDVDKSVSQYVDRELTRRFDVDPDSEIDEIKSRVAKLQDRLAEATANGGEYRSQVNERLDLQAKNQNQNYHELRELKKHAQDNVERIVNLENAVNSLEVDSEETKEYLANSTTSFRLKTLEDLNIHARLLSLESFEQEFARRTFALEKKVDLHWKNVRTLLGIDSAKKAPSAADIMKRTVKAASAFADAMKGDM